MALFRISKGTGNFPDKYIEGYCYFNQDTGRFAIDTTNDADGRKLINPDSIVNIERSGITYTATRADGTTFNFSQQNSNASLG